MDKWMDKWMMWIDGLLDGTTGVWHFGHVLLF